MSKKRGTGREPAEPAAAAGPADKPRRLWLRFLPLAVIALGFAAAIGFGLQRHLTLEALVERHEALAGFVRANLALALAAYVALYAVVAGLSLPGATILTVAGGFIFGGWLGGAFAVVGATLGATILFLAARSSVGAALTARAGPWLKKFRAGFQRDAISYLLFLRLVSLFPFWLVNLALATTGVKLTTFMWTTFVGIIPGTLAFSLAGAGLDSLAAAQRAAYEGCVAAGRSDCAFTLSPQNLVTREMLIAFAALGVVSLAPIVAKRWFGAAKDRSADV